MEEWKQSTLGLDGGERPASRPQPLYLRGNSPDNHWIGAGLDAMKWKLSCLCQKSNPGRSAGSADAIPTPLLIQNAGTSHKIEPVPTISHSYIPVFLWHMLLTSLNLFLGLQRRPSNGKFLSISCVTHASHRLHHRNIPEFATSILTSCMKNTVLVRECPN
jgi:hypothetical protein